MHGVYSECRMGLDTGELKLEVYGHVAFQCHSPRSALADGSARELYTPGELGCVHHWVGVDGHQQILVSLQKAVLQMIHDDPSIIMKYYNLVKFVEFQM